MAAAIVSRRIRAAARLRGALVAAESLLLGLSAGLATLAAARASGATELAGQVIAIAAVASVLAAIGWGLERREDRASIARAIDRDARLGGAVLTAFQAESADRVTPLAEALAARVAPRISATRYLRGIARASAPLLAVPFAALALWGIAAEAEPRSSAMRPASPAADGEARAVRVEAFRSEAEELAAIPGLPGALAKEARRLVARAGTLLARARSGSIPASEVALMERELARRLDLLHRAISAGAVTSADAVGTMAGPDEGIDRSSDTPMKASNPPTSREPAAPSSTAGIESGVVTSRWWSERYDAVVDRWIESRRAGRAGRAR